MNQKGIKRAIAAHRKTSHRDFQQIQFTFKIEMARGWDYLSVPQRAELGGSSQDAVSTQDRSEGSAHWSRGVPESQELDEEADTECASTKKLAAKEVSTLRRALLGQAASSHGFTQFRCRRGNKVGPIEQSGVYCVQELHSRWQAC